MQQKKESILDLSISEKYMLTVREASVYFHIGIKHMRRLSKIMMKNSVRAVG